jgi:amino acid adenylation domain-containing protein
MLPAAWVVLPALPLTAHGKIDRRALPPPDAGRQPLETEVVAPGTELESFLAGLWRDALKIERVGIHDDFFALGGNSISGAILINRLQEELREIVHVVAIFDAPTVAGLAKYLIAQSPEAVSRTFGPLDPGAAASGLTLRSSRVDATRAGELRRLVRPLAPAPGTLPGTAKNPPAVFVLSPPRSGSTLLRVMLAGHPGLFAPPELELLSFGTLGARREAFSGRDRFWLEGLLRAVMEIRGCDAATAEALVEDWERQDRSTQEVYRHLQGWLGHRILVDKTPSYALDRAVLDRAEEVFEGACYIHLIRHPCGMIRSFEEAKLDQVFFNREHPFSRRELAELIWLVSHQNIAAFLARVPRERQLSVRFEELLSDPAAVLGTVCAFLGIDFHPDMAQPYEAGSRRMTDGVHAVSRMLGDVKFHQHAGIDRATADRWREVCSEEELGDPTLEMAALLGYQVRRPTWQPIERRPVPPGEPLPLSYAQERLWFLEQMAPGSSVYNIPTAVRFTGRLDTAALARALGEVVHRHEALRTIFRTVDGAPVQIVSPASSLALPMVDLSALPARVRQEEARQLAGAASWSPFDLARGPLFRAGLLRLTAGDHLVLATLHHIVGDGWSMRILNREVAALYKAFAEGEPSPLQPLPVQYADFARWQREWLQGEALERELAHWQEQLRGLPPLLELPTDRPRPAVQTFRGAACALELDSPRLWSGLQALGRETGTTPFMVLVAGFHALLSRYSGQDDVAVGIPVAGRTRRELQELIGFFVNTLVLRGDLANGPGFRELLARTRVRSLAAFAHQELPFEKLVEALEPARSLGHSPLFQAMFTLQILGEDEAPAVEGLNAAAVGLESHTAKFDLTLALSEAPQRFSGALVYNTDLFDAATARRMLDHFAALLSAAVSSPEVPLADLPLMNDSERHQVATEWGAGTTPDRALRNALERAHEWAVRSPEALAVGAGDEWVTYGELARRARTLARRLRRERVRGETVVGIFLERSVELIVGIWATLLAEGAWLPFDPESPPERVGTIFADAGARVMLTSSSLRERLPALEATVLELDRMGWTAEATGAELVPDIEPDGLAYVIYTSGSTGRPKGVEVTHRGLANLIRWYERSFDLGPGCRVTQLASPSFDASVLEIWPCLASGASLHVAPAPVRSSPSALLDWLRREGITHCFLPTPLAEAVFQEEWPGEMALRFLLTGGDRLRRAPDREPGFRLVNLYGPTEGSVVSTSSRVEAGRAGAPPIGRPISGTWVCVQDAGGRLQPPGVAGELCIGGPGVARGYLRRPDLTAERFVPGEGGQAGERLYRTGDRARWLADGQLEFLDRLDQQVKVRGFRIEPGEIEAALAAHPAVREAVVSVREDSRSERSLVAYLATGEEPLPAASELRRFLGRTLPEHMIPAAFVGLPELPLTPQGKVDRRALHSSFPAAAAASSLAQPRTPIEEIVAALWSEVLHVEQVGPQDDFFQLGGHSLLATRVISRLRSVFRIELPLRDLFASPSLAELSRTIENLLAGGSDEMQALRPRPRDTALPLSFAQQRLWFIDRLQPGSPVYNLCSAVRFTGALDAPALAATFSEITRRHEVLRTTFEEHGGEPVQVIHPWAPRPLPVIDLSALPEEVRNREGRSLAAAESLRSFDLASGPLFRAGLLRFAAAEHVVVATMHHIVGDGWSVGVLHQEVSALYNSFTRGLDSPLPELAVQYADYALWQRDWMSGELLERELAYWRERLRGIPPVLPLPADHPRPARPTYRGGRRGLRWPADLAGALQTLGRRNGATLFMVLLAGFQSLLSRLTGERNICVGTPIAGRNRVEIENLIGFFVNTLVLRADLGGEPSFLTLLERVREASLEAYAHPNLPFERLVQDLAPERTMSYSPLFQVLLVLQNAPEGGGSIAGLAVESLGSVERPTARYDLALSVREAGGSLLGLMEYATDLFEGVTVERMLRQLEGLLGAAAASPRSVLGELPLLTSGELHQVLLEWNDVPGGEEPGRCLHELFESWADAQPAAPAVVWETGSMSYGALERHANRLAWHLRGLGVGPEARVGLCVDRTGALPVGVLGILKAGGAFVPLDPSYPRERLGWIVADAGLDLLVSDQESLGLLPAEGLRTVLLDRDSGEIELASAARPASGVGAGHLAYVIYTSGSTGRPKGVLVEHRGLANVAAEQAEVFRAGVGDSVLQMASPGFDAAVAEIVTSLCLGGRLCLARRESLLPGPGLLELLRSRSVTHVTMTPAVLAELPWEALAELRTLVVAGEACPAELVGRWGDGRRLVNAYGPTEATIWSTAEVCAPVGGAPAIGRPIANVRVHVLDAALRPVPVYVAGELCVAGVGVARGYLGLPDLTAERFVPDPYGKEPGSRLYRTGDLARYRADGRIDFLGRLDEQVKIRGVRIELGEIEAALRRHPAVRDAAVAAREEGPAGRRLLAWVVAADAGQPPAAAELRRFLAASLPAPMIPAAVESITALPVTPHGKIDRLAIARLTSGGPGLRSRVAPRNESELRLLEIWEEVLGTGPLGVTEDFFQAGGHSLLAVRLLARIREKTGKELPLATLFTGSSVERMAALLERDLPRHREPLVALRTVEASRAPLFLVHPVGGNVLCYAELVRAMEPDRSIYGLQAPDPGAAFPASLEAMAAGYLEAIRQVQPEPPYHLAGWSMGGVLAFEMARQLHRRGRQQVGLLALLDAEPPLAAREPTGEMDLLRMFARDLAGLSLGESPRRLPELAPGEPALEELFGFAHRSGLIPPGLDLATTRRLFDVFRADVELLRAYAGKPCPGPALLLLGAETVHSRRDVAPAWGTLIENGLAVEITPGQHYSLLRRPQVESVAERLHAALLRSEC